MGPHHPRRPAARSTTPAPVSAHAPAPAHAPARRRCTLRRTGAAVVAVLALTALAACTPIEQPGLGATAAGGAASSSAATAGTPSGAAATSATPSATATTTASAAGTCAPVVAPKDRTDVDLAPGPRTADAGDDPIRPITTSPDPQLPVKVHSADGRTVTVRSADRIVAVDLYGTLGETVFSLGLGDHLVGRDISTGFPEAKDVPVVTKDGHGLNVEAILDLDPTVILTDDSILTDSTRDQLAASGVPVVLFDPERTIAGIGPRIEDVAAALGVAADGKALAQRTEDEVCAARQTVPTDAGTPRVAFVYLRGSNITMLFGPGSGADQLVEAIGAQDAGTAIGLTREYVPVTAEAMIGAAPDAYLVMTDGLASAGGLKAMLKIPGIAQTPAGEAKRVVDMDGSELLTFGPRTGATLRALVTALYGES